MSWLALIIDLIQPKMTWKKNLKEESGLSTSGLPVGMSVGDCLDC